MFNTIDIRPKLHHQQWRKLVTRHSACQHCVIQYRV